MFKTLSDRFVIVAALILSVSALTSIATRLGSLRSHADNQHRRLHPDHYLAKLVTKADLKQLSDPSIRTVNLSDGSGLVKSDRPEWEKEMIPFYKPIANSDYYIQIRTKGTAHVLRYCFESVFLAIISILMIVLLCIYHLIKSGKGQHVAPEHAADASALSLALSRLMECSIGRKSNPTFCASVLFPSIQQTQEIHPSGDEELFAHHPQGKRQKTMCSP